MLFLAPPPLPSRGAPRPNAPVERRRRAPSAGRVKGWRLRRRRGSLLLSVSFESALWPPPYPGFHPLPHRTGHEVCPHPALRQPLFRWHSGFQTVGPATARHIESGLAVLRRLAHRHSLRRSSRDFSMGGVSPFGAHLHWRRRRQCAPSLTSPLDTAEVEAFPSHQVVLSWRSTVLHLHPPAVAAGAVWPPGSYHDRTSTGKQTMTFRTHQPLVRRGAPIVSSRRRAFVRFNQIFSCYKG